MASEFANNPKRIIFHSIPFYILTLLALNLVPRSDDPTVLSFLMKCLPAVALIFLVRQVPSEPRFKFDKDQKDHLDNKLIYRDRNKLRKNVIPALAFSVLGDGFMAWPQNYYTILGGTCFFTFAHLFYIKSFGWSPLDMPVGIFVYTISIIASSILFKYVDLVNQIVMGTYSLVLVTTTWRAIARYEIVDSGKKWQKWSLIAGAITFCATNLTIGIFNFKIEATPFEAQSFILFTYYMAQYLIVLGII